jgi:hypothetical protein
MQPCPAWAVAPGRLPGPARPEQPDYRPQQQVTEARGSQEPARAPSPSAGDSESGMPPGPGPQAAGPLALAAGPSRSVVQSESRPALRHSAVTVRVTVTARRCESLALVTVGAHCVNVTRES